jgi:hypothetical protein
MAGVLLNPEHWAEDRSRRWEYWRYIKLAREEFLIECPNSDYFGNWLSEKYGIKLHYDRDGNITDESTIIDEQKYLLFQLKYV